MKAAIRCVSLAATRRRRCYSHCVGKPVLLGFIYGDGGRLFCSSSRKEKGISSVSRSNFWVALEKLKDELPSADFVAIDMEMSGIGSARGKGLDFSCSTPRYLSLKHSAHSFAVLQFGISLFKWSFNKFVAYPYSFYVFPRNELPLELQSPNMLFQASALEFLAEHQFDFNLCISDGVSYLSKEQEVEARVKLGLDFGQKNGTSNELDISISEINTSDETFSEGVQIRLRKWHNETQRSLNATTSNEIKQCHSIQLKSESSKDSISDVLADMMSSKMHGHKFASATSSKMTMGSIPRPSLTLELDNDHQVHLVKQILRQQFNDLISTTKRSTSKSFEMQIFYTRSREDLVSLQKELERHSREIVENQMYEATGFRHVIDALISSEKPIVGHNCALDFAHIHDKFIAPLPATVAEFSSSLLRHFPYIIDTKCILTADPRIRHLVGYDTSLSKVYSHIFSIETLKRAQNLFLPSTGLGNALSKVEIVVAADIGRYTPASCLQFKHDAGCDALMTGSIFAQLCHLLQVEFSIFHGNILENSAIAIYKNHLYLGSMVLDLQTGKEATRKELCLKGPL